MKKEVKKIAKTSFWLYATPPTVIIVVIGIFLIYQNNYIIGSIILVVGLVYFSLRYQKLQQWLKSN